MQNLSEIAACFGSFVCGPCGNLLLGKSGVAWDGKAKKLACARCGGEAVWHTLTPFEAYDRRYRHHTYEGGTHALTIFFCRKCRRFLSGSEVRWSSWIRTHILRKQGFVCSKCHAEVEWHERSLET